MKDSFVFYRSFYTAISKVKNKETRADIYDAICELGLNENVQELDDSVGSIIMDLITPQIVANNEKYEKGLNGGRPTEYNHDEIINLIEQGLSNKEITEKIGCSVSTVKNIRQKVDNKSKTSGYWRQKPNVNENDNENVNDNVNDLKEKEQKESADLFSLIEESFGRTLSPIEYEKISTWKDNELTRYAVKESILNGARGIRYIETVLASWEAKGFKTPADVDYYKQNRQDYKNKKEEPIPEWIGKENDSSTMSKEDEEEWDKLMEDFNE